MLLAVTFLYTESPIHPTNHYNVLFLMNLHSPSKSNTNSTQILGFILIRLSFTIGHFHTRTLQKNVANFVFLFAAQFSATVPSFTGIRIMHTRSVGCLTEGATAA